MKNSRIKKTVSQDPDQNLFLKMLDSKPHSGRSFTRFWVLFSRLTFLSEVKNCFFLCCVCVAVSRRVSPPWWAAGKKEADSPPPGDLSKLPLDQGIVVCPEWFFQIRILLFNWFRIFIIFWALYSCLVSLLGCSLWREISFLGLYFFLQKGVFF